MRVVHLMGSAVSAYYESLSTFYAQGCVDGAQDELTRAHFDFAFAIVHATADGPRWSFPAELSEKAIAAAPRLTHAEGVQCLAAIDADVCVPHMFCYPGMTTYRALLDMLGVPILGCPPACMALATDKFQTRAVVAAAGVRVPTGELLRAGERPSLALPFVLKPCREDNSMGVSVVRRPEELDAALAEAFRFDERVVCEQFVPPGREIRCAVIEDEHGEPTRVLPCLEYFLSEEHPIRTPGDKLASSEDGKVTGLASGARKCPAELSDELRAKLADATIRSHRALGCRDFSLFDFRVDPEGEVFFLEACPVCSFSPKSVIVSLADAAADADVAHPALFHTLLRRAAGRGQKAKPKAKPDEKPVQVFGMHADCAR